MRWQAAAVAGLLMAAGLASPPAMAGSQDADRTAGAGSPDAGTAPPIAGKPAVPSTASVTPMPRVYAPVRSRQLKPSYPWREEIVTTIFWIGEKPTANNPTPNHKSSWDPEWSVKYGGYDDPDPSSRAWDFRPKGFHPGQNPFYVALPYNDIVNHRQTKPEARRVIPWFKERFEREGRSVCKGQWIAVRFGKKICYAQWEDCGPYHTDDWEYVFKGARPKNKTENGGAALDISPAVRDYLGIRSGAHCDWRFVDVHEVPAGPWRKFGENNHFVQAAKQQDAQRLAYYDELRRKREEWLKRQAYPVR